MFIFSVVCYEECRTLKEALNEIRHIRYLAASTRYVAYNRLAFLVQKVPKTKNSFTSFMQQIPLRLEVSFFFGSEGTLSHSNETLTSLGTELDNPIYDYANQLLNIQFNIIIITA